MKIDENVLRVAVDLHKTFADRVEVAANLAHDKLSAHYEWSGAFSGSDSATGSANEYGVRVRAMIIPQLRGLVKVWQTTGSGNTGNDFSIGTEYEPIKQFGLTVTYDESRNSGTNWSGLSLLARYYF